MVIDAQTQYAGVFAIGKHLHVILTAFMSVDKAGGASYKHQTRLLITTFLCTGIIS
jgi:hypothetical protein